MGDDRAECGKLGDSTAALMPALERFWRFEGDDPVAAGRHHEWRATLDEPLPQAGAGLPAVLDQLEHVIIPNGLRTGAPGFAGWVTTTSTTAGAVASFAATVSGAQRYWITPYNFLETVALRWIATLLGMDPHQGLFLSGGSIANLVCIGAARQYAFERRGVDAGRDGLPSGMTARLYASAEVHHSLIRAAGALGLGRRSVRLVDVDDGMRIDPAALERALDDDARAGIVPIAIVANAGTVNTGSVDPIAALVRIARSRGIWLHVDGAYGAFGRLDPAVAPLYAGMEAADSLAVDPHKWLAAPLGSGVAFVRDRGLMERAFTMEPADYAEGALVDGEVNSMFDSAGEDFLQLGPEMSAQSRGAVAWAIIKEIGAEGVRDRVVRHNGFARRLHRLASADERLEPLHEPTLSICCFRYVSPGADESQLDALNAEIAQRLRVEGMVPSTTRVRGSYALRPCFINPRTTEADVERLARRAREIGDEIAGPFRTSEETALA